MVTDQVAAWKPKVPGIAEVFHAHFTEHVYPMHAHNSWTLLIVDSGTVRYDLDRHEHGALGAVVTLLPPDVPHNGRAATPDGFRKRVLYLDRAGLGDDLIGRAVDTPAFVDPLLLRRIDQLHQALDSPGEELAAESRLLLVSERLAGRLRGHRRGPADAEAVPVPRTAAHLLRELIDARVVPGLSMTEAAALLHFHPTHLIRAFTREFGLPPHQYLTSRRVDLARGLLLGGRPAGEAAVESGFYDQSHLTRHFRRVVGVNPGRFAG
jgi:AraC-like DNA-binding protein